MAGVTRATPSCAPNDDDDDTWVGCSTNVSCNPHVPAVTVTTTWGGGQYEPQPPVCTRRRVRGWRDAPLTMTKTCLHRDPNHDNPTYHYLVYSCHLSFI